MKNCEILENWREYTFHCLVFSFTCIEEDEFKNDHILTKENPKNEQNDEDC